MPIVDTRDVVHQTNILASFLPNGPMFEAKNIPDTVLRTILRVLSIEYHRACSYIESLIYNFFPNQTTFFISKWERTVGIPDDCFDGKGDLETRRLHILCKLIYMNVTTLEDVMLLAQLLGYRIEVFYGGSSGAFRYTLPMVFYENTKAAKFTMYVRVYGIKPNTFQFTFPIEFKTIRATLLECVLNKVKQANVKLIMEYYEE